MRKPTFGEKLRYAFDNVLSRGTIALIGLLALASVALITIIALVVRLTRVAPDIGFAQLVWMGLMRTLDSGTMGGDQGSWPFLFAMLGVTLGGIFVISTLISILTAGLEGRIENLRKGRSKVIETGHTVILGWSEQIFAIVSELVIANANQRRSCIVIMGDKDKVVMEDEIRQKVGHTDRTRVVCRSGNSIELADLNIVSPQTAKSILLVSPEDERPDAQVIKTMLALINAPDRRPEPYHIIATIRSPRNMDVARLVGKNEVSLILVGDLIARIIAQTCRQSGLSSVYTELLDFAGNEFYFRDEPLLAGKSFAEALFAYEDSTVAGIIPLGGVVQLNPPLDTRIRAGDKLIMIAEDDDTTHLSGLTDYKINTGAIRPYGHMPPAPERTLILGWNWRAPIILTELDHYVAPGSVVTVVADISEDEQALSKRCPQLRNQSCEFRNEDTTDRRTLEDLHIETYDHVIILCYSDTLDTQTADASTLITLLHLRDIAERIGHHLSITSEMLDIRNRNLAEVTRADDFIVSDKLISLMLAQVSENPGLEAVFTDLFDPEGSEVYLKPAASYVTPAVPINFYTVLEAARQRGEVAIGYRRAAQSEGGKYTYEVVVNPKKSEALTFSEADRIIVLAES